MLFLFFATDIHVLTPMPMYAFFFFPCGSSDSTRKTKYRLESSTGSTEVPVTSYGHSAKSSPVLASSKRIEQVLQLEVSMIRRRPFQRKASMSPHSAAL